MQFTAQQIEDWKAFVHVQASGKYNMLGDNARQAVGIGEVRYRFVIDNYSEIKAAAKENKSEAIG
jgi:hypothetical protein